MRLHKTLAALGVLAVAACDSDPVAPPTALAPPTIAFQDVPVDQEAAPQHMVLTHGAPQAGLLAAITDAGGEVVYQHDIGFVFVRGLSDEAATEVSGLQSVATVQADEWFEGEQTPYTQVASATSITSPEDPSGAAFFDRQWHMRAIKAQYAWKAGRTGSSDVTVAILDTGVDPAHLDLDGRVDLSRSISFVEIDDIFAEAFFPGRPLVTDLHFHGTHVAATAVSNGIVAAGVTSMPTIMGVKVCTFTDFTCSTAAVFSGILFAIENGADVVNLSLGGVFPQTGNEDFVQFIQDVFKLAWKQGVTMVVAAGNSASDLDNNGDLFAAYCDARGVICVAATGPTSAPSPEGPFVDVDAPAPYTNFGRRSIDVAAPGGNFADGLPWGGVWAACSTTSLLVPDCQASPTFALSVVGTSMATPHVSGLAALVVEDQGRRPARVRAKIIRRADDIGPRGPDEFSGRGRINVPRSIKMPKRSRGKVTKK